MYYALHPKLQAEVNVATTCGWAVESGGTTAVIMRKGHDTSHLLHLVLSVLTMGLWVPVWIAVAIMAGTKRRRLWVDPKGELRSARL